MLIRKFGFSISYLDVCSIHNVENNSIYIEYKILYIPHVDMIFLSIPHVDRLSIPHMDRIVFFSYDI